MQLTRKPALSAVSVAKRSRRELEMVSKSCQIWLADDSNKDNILEATREDLTTLR
ncbi:MAG: hypothetical protein WD625_05350 [Balneolales bacterium]